MFICVIQGDKIVNNNDIDKMVEDVNNCFVSNIALNINDEKVKLAFFREKYVQFLIYSYLKKMDWDVVFEYTTKHKFTRKGKNPRSGDHDLIIFDEFGNPVAAFEFFLGYEIDEKKGDYEKRKVLESSKFKDHLYGDYEKLINSGISNIHILNYFYKGKSERASDGRRDRKENSYQWHFSRCEYYCEKLLKEHKKSYPSTKLVIWMVEVRDDGKEKNKPRKIY